MRLFVVLAATLVAGGVVIAVWVPGSFSTGGWATGIVLTAFAFLLRHSATNIRSESS